MSEETRQDEKRCEECGKKLAKQNVTGRCAQHRIFTSPPRRQRPSLYHRWD